MSRDPKNTEQHMKTIRTYPTTAGVQLLVPEDQEKAAQAVLGNS
jgi:hypothetical protein